MSEAAVAAPAPVAEAASAEGGADINVTPSVDQGVQPQAGVSAQMSATEEVQHWTSSLDPDLQNYVNIKGFKEPADVLKSYKNFEKLQGAPQERVLKLPNEADSPDWDGVYTKLGKPATPEGYGFEIADDADASGAESVQHMAKMFHELNLTKDQGSQLMERVQEFEGQLEAREQAEYNARVTQEENDLKKDWGMAFDQNMKVAKKAVRAFGLPDAALDALEQSMGFKNTMSFFHDLGTKISEAAFHSEIESNSFAGDNVLNPEQAKAKISELKNDRSFIEKYAAGDTKAKQQMARLHMMAYPD